MLEPLTKYFPNGLLIGEVPKYKNVAFTKFKVREYITTLIPEEELMTEKQHDKLASIVGGVVTALAMLVAYYLIVAYIL